MLSKGDVLEIFLRPIKNMVAEDIEYFRDAGNQFCDRLWRVGLEQRGKVDYSQMYKSINQVKKDCMRGLGTAKGITSEYRDELYELCIGEVSAKLAVETK